MAVDGLANRAERVLGLKATPLEPKLLAKEIKFGVLSSIPLEALMLGEGYRRGDVDAKTYLASTLSNAVASGAWTIGGALVGSLVPGGSLIGGALGFAGGMLTHSVWNRLLGKHLIAGFKSAIPERVAKPLADGFSRFVAAPLTDYVWKPITGVIKKHKVLAGAIAAGALLLLPAPLRMGLLKTGAMMAGGTALGMAGDAFVLDKFLPKAPEQAGQGAANKPGDSASALGEYEAAIALDGRSRKLVRETFPHVFQPKSSLPKGLEKDLEKVFYLKLLALTSQDPAQAKELEATFQTLSARVDAHWNQGAPVARAQGSSLSGRSLTG
jgi:hypothetical protein